MTDGERYFKYWILDHWGRMQKNPEHTLEFCSAYEYCPIRNDGIPCLLARSGNIGFGGKIDSCRLAVRFETMTREMLASILIMIGD